MAEILLSLTIIGVVAAITLPSLTGNINERTWNTQRKALYARMSQALALMPSLNGYGTLTEGDSSTSAVDTAAETFVTAGLSKVLKINNICDNQHLQDCGMPATITNMLGSKIILPTTLYELNGMFSLSSASVTNTKAVAFETANGESLTAYYNPKCKSDDTTSGNSRLSQKIMCVNFIYDLNGKKGPNTFGKDIGVIAAINPVDPRVLAPIPFERNTTSNNVAYGKGCVQHGHDGRIPDKHELSVMNYNMHIMGIPAQLYVAREEMWGEYFGVGTRGKVGGAFLRCIKR